MYVFKFVPMLNPDGVILGNYRTSLSGTDLNRQWQSATSRVYPEIFNTKQMLKKTLVSREIELFVDVHGHSRKSNVFMYGCGTQKSGTLTRNNEKVFPYMFSQRNLNFEFNDCAYKMQKDKEGTGRIVVFKDLNIQNSYTLESSFCGPTSGTYNDQHFTPTILRAIGADFCRTLGDYNDKEKRAAAKREISVRYPVPPKEKASG